MLCDRGKQITHLTLEGRGMLVVDDVLQTFMGLSAGERLIWIDSWARMFLDFPYDQAGNCDSKIVHMLLHIGRMLQVMREDLATIDDLTNRGVITRVLDIISVMQADAPAGMMLAHFGERGSAIVACHRSWLKSDLLI